MKKMIIFSAIYFQFFVLKAQLIIENKMQETHYWCWAASTQMVLSSFNIKVSQCEIVNRYLKTCICKEEIYSISSGCSYFKNIDSTKCAQRLPPITATPGTGYYESIERNVLIIDSLLKSYDIKNNEIVKSDDTQKYEKIYSAIKSGKPIIGLTMDNPSFHVVVIYDIEKSGSNYFLYLNDPYQVTRFRKLSKKKFCCKFEAKVNSTTNKNLWFVERKRNREFYEFERFLIVSN